MDLYVLLGFGFVVLVFILIFRRKQTKNSAQILQGNVNVQPLFQQRWAKMQQASLHESAALDEVE